MFRIFEQYKIKKYHQDLDEYEELGEWLVQEVHGNNIHFGKYRQSSPQSMTIQIPCSGWTFELISSPCTVSFLNN